MEVDEVIEAVLSGNDARLESLLRFTTAPRTHTPGLGGPPKCFYYPDQPPEGMLVEAFYLSTCEEEWRTDTSPIVDGMLGREVELYGVVGLNLEAPIWGEPYMPEPEYGVILLSGAAAESVGVLLGVEDDGGVTYIDYVCVGRPDFFLGSGAVPAYGDNVALLLRGPAYE